MTMQTIDTRHWHARYEALQYLADEELARGELEPIGALRDAIEKAWGAAADAFKAHGAKASTTDPAEEVVAVLTRYLFLSNPDSEVLKHVALLIDAKVGQTDAGGEMIGFWLASVGQKPIVEGSAQGKDPSDVQRRHRLR